VVFKKSETIPGTKLSKNWDCWWGGWKNQNGSTAKENSGGLRINTVSGEKKGRKKRAPNGVGLERKRHLKGRRLQKKFKRYSLLLVGGKGGGGKPIFKFKMVSRGEVMRKGGSLTIQKGFSRSGGKS